MASQLVSTAVEETSKFLNNLIKCSQCSRRKQTNAPPTNAIATKKVSNKRLANKKITHTMQSDSAETSSTEVGSSISNNEFSDKSYQTDASSIRMRTPPGLAAPPGLEGFGPNNPEFLRHGSSSFNAGAPCFIPGAALRAESSLNAKAALFQPGCPTGLSLNAAIPPAETNSQQLRRSIGMLKGALEEWEANLPEVSAPPVPQPVSAPLAPAETNSLMALQQALANLTPQDTASLRTFLDASHGTGPMNSGMQQPSQNGAWQHAGSRPQQQQNFNPQAAFERPKERLMHTPGGIQRSFTPFQGNKNPPWEQQAKPARVARKPAVPEEDEESLRSHLKDLASIPNEKVLMLRRINRLGLESHATLQEHFSQFGTVERVMVAPTRAKAKPGQTKARVRAAPLGFLVMSTVEGAQAALKLGAEHIVQGECIGVLQFSSHSVESEE